MKSAIVFIFFFVIATQSFAQFDQDKAFYTAKAIRYKRMKNTGTFLTIAGGVLAVIGVSTLSHSSYSTTTYGGRTQTSSTGNPGAGALEFLLGTAGLGVGIPLWAVGAHSEKKYLNKLGEMSLGFNINRNKTGLVLTYRF